MSVVTMFALSRYLSDSRLDDSFGPDGNVTSHRRAAACVSFARHERHQRLKK